MWEDENVVSLVVQLVCCWTGGERNNQPSAGAAKVMDKTAAGEDGIRRRRNTMTSTMTMGDNDDDDDNGNGATGNEVDDDGDDDVYGDGRRRR
jgi:hypothetical protein